MKQHNLKYEELSALDYKTTQPDKTLHSESSKLPRVEVDGQLLSNPDSNVLEDYLLAKGLIDATQSTSNVNIPNCVSLMDEENEAIRSKTTRFF